MSGGVELDDFRDAFVGEAEELLITANANALGLEVALREGSHQARHVRELFRAVHTIKGLAAMVAVEPIVALSHALEELLRVADRDNATISSDNADLILQALQQIKDRVRSVANRQAVAEPPLDLVRMLETSRPGKVASVSGAETIFTLEDNVATKLTAQDRQQLGQGVLEGRRALRFDFSPSPALADAGHTITTLRERLGKVAEIVKVVPVADPKAPSGLSFVLLVITDKTDEVLAAAVEVPLAKPSDVVSLRATSRDQQDELMQHDAVRVDVGRLDVALDRLSDLIITRFRLDHAVTTLKERGVETRDLAGVAADISRQLRALRVSMMAVRMVPLEDLFNRMRLVVRGLIRGSNKRVKMVLDAGHTEVDKGVAEQLFPAIVHLLRNSVDHGIEPQFERERQGKPGEATITITCKQKSSTQVEIVIEDDGRGIDALAVARRAKIKTPKTDAELLEVLCAPGFSTRVEADTTSGRGMGMDIVRRAINEQLSGDMTLETSVGRGTRFTLRVPLSIAIVDAFVFRCGGQRFVAPNAVIEEAIDLPKLSRATANSLAMLEHRGATIPFLELSEVLGMPSLAPSPQAFLVRRHGEMLALGVERILTQQEIVVRPLEDKLVKISGINGATDLGDGQPTLVLDLLRLAQQARRKDAA